MWTCSMSWDGAVGTVTRGYELDYLGFISLQGQEICYFLKMPGLALGPTQPSTQCLLGFLFPRV